jgi:hypothetical protein
MYDFHNLSLYEQEKVEFRNTERVMAPDPLTSLSLFSIAVTTGTVLSSVPILQRCSLSQHCFQKSFFILLKQWNDGSVGRKKNENKNRLNALIPSHTAMF